MHRHATTTLVLFAIIGLPFPTTAQTSEDHGVITLSAEDLGPFRPQERPTLDKVEELIVKQTNQFRNKHDLKPVESNKLLKKTAQDFAAYMAKTDRYGHQADERTPAERVKAHDYKLCQIAENIAYFFKTEGFDTGPLATKAVDGWINSPPHRKNMLRPTITEIGVGVAQSETTGVFYAVQLFGRPKSQMIEFSLKNSAGRSIAYTLGDRTYALPARYTRTHQMCTPATLTLKAAAKSVPPRKPGNGDELVVTDSQGELVFQQHE